MEWYHCIGWSGILFSSLSPIPQIWQTYKTKQVRDINPYFFISRTIGNSCYIVYNYFNDMNIIMMTSSIVPLILDIILLSLYKKFKEDQLSSST